MNFIGFMSKIFSLLPLFVLGLLSSCSDKSNKSPSYGNNEIPAVKDYSDLNRFGIMVPPSLMAEFDRGITAKCSLNSGLESALKDKGLELISCGNGYSVIVGRDSIGVLDISNKLDRQPLIITFGANKNLEKQFDDLPTFPESRYHLEEIKKIKHRFSILSDSGLRFNATFDPKGELFGYVIVENQNVSRCKFSYFEDSLPQTKCFLKLKEMTIKIETNSTNYSAVERFIEGIKYIPWG